MFAASDINIRQDCMISLFTASDDINIRQNSIILFSASDDVNIRQNSMVSVFLHLLMFTVNRSRRKTKRQTEETMGRQHQRVDWPSMKHHTTET